MISSIFWWIVIWLVMIYDTVKLLTIKSDYLIIDVWDMVFSMERDIPHRDTPGTFLFIHFNSKYLNFNPNNANSFQIIIFHSKKYFFVHVLLMFFQMIISSVFLNVWFVFQFCFLFFFSNMFFFCFFVFLIIFVFFFPIFMLIVCWFFLFF